MASACIHEQGLGKVLKHYIKHVLKHFETKDTETNSIEWLKR